MSSLCLSAASILRCESLTRLEVILLIIPTALEVLFATSLIVVNWGVGRRHLWITAEGWIYFSLAIIDMLSHIIPAARDHTNVFKVLDTFLAATSFIPILCYIIFIFLFARAELIDILPRRFQMVSTLMLLIFIPAIITLNELSSFIGISYGINANQSQPVLAIEKNLTLWTFLTSFTLALLTAYQAINFSFAFYRLVKAVVNKRRIETISSDEAHLLRGIGWITGGLKLGAIETVIGFAGGDFGCAITRRIMRLLARASLIIGLIKGLDTEEDFTHLAEELSGAKRKEFRRSRLRDLISNPRQSTFQQLTPTATAFHSARRTSKVFPKLSPLRVQAGMKHLPEEEEARGLERPDILHPGRERVTIHFEKGTPKLFVRFSGPLEVPDIPSHVFDPRPLTATRRAKLPSPLARTSQTDPSRNSPLLDALGIHDSVAGSNTPASTSRSLDSQTLPKVHNPASKTKRSESSGSEWSTTDSYSSLSTVRELASQFPPLPVRVLDPIERSPAVGSSSSFWDDTVSVTSKGPLSISRESNTQFSISAAGTSQDTRPRIASLASVGESLATTPMTAVSGYTPISTNAQINEPYLDLESALGSGRSQAFTRGNTSTAVTVARPADWIDYDAIPGPGLSPVAEEQSEGRISPTVHSDYGHSRSGSLGTLRISWLQEAQVTRAVSLRSHMARIKNVRNVPMRSTPQPIMMGYSRRSLRIEQIRIPPREDAYRNVEIIQGSVGSNYSVLRDSGVLGIE